MSNCESCGRGDGHFTGCPTVRDPLAAAFLVKLDEAAKANECAFDGCTNPKRPKGKGPAPKYCDEHSDPKNRK